MHIPISIQWLLLLLLAYCASHVRATPAFNEGKIDNIMTCHLLTLLFQSMAIKRMDQFVLCQHTIRILVLICVCVISLYVLLQYVPHVSKVLLSVWMAVVARHVHQTLFLHVLVLVHLACMATFTHARIHKQWTFPISMHLKKIHRPFKHVHPIWDLVVSPSGYPILIKSCGEIARPQIMEL